MFSFISASHQITFSPLWHTAGTGLGLGLVSLWDLIANEPLPWATCTFHVIAIATTTPHPSVSAYTSHSCCPTAPRRGHTPVCTLSFFYFNFFFSSPLISHSLSYIFFFFFPYFGQFNLNKSDQPRSEWWNNKSNPVTFGEQKVRISTIFLPQSPVLY